MKAVILAGGAITPTPSLKERVADAAFVVAADSGLRHASPLGLTPQQLVGDFDSVSDETLRLYPDLPRETHPPEKDALDLELAIDHALREGATELVIVGALGGRLDQSLAAVFIAARLKEGGVGVALESGSHRIVYLSDGEEVALELPVGQTFSLLSLVPRSRVSIENAKYALKESLLEYGVGLGVSNVVTGTPLVVSVSAGLVGVVVEEGEPTPLVTL